MMDSKSKAMAGQTIKINTKINDIIARIEKEYGKGVLMQLDKAATATKNIIPTGSMAFNTATGIGGYPRGRIIEIYGPEASGKTTLALHAIAEIQKQNGQAVFIDVEHALDPVYAARLGVNNKKLIIGQPDAGEEAMDIVESLVKTKMVDLIVVDSVAALIPKAELEGQIGDQVVGGQARLMSKALRKLRSIVHENNCLLMFINQTRAKIGGFYNNAEVTSGGNALKFYASLRIDVRRFSKIIENNTVIGSKVRVKIVKNKLATPFKEAMFDIIYGYGINQMGELLDYAVNFDVVQKAGS